MKELSKFLSYVLRHKPDAIGVEMSHDGWVNINELIEKSNAAGKALTRELLNEIVKTDSKGRYAFSEDGNSIRANQGHSIDVDLNFKKAVPPVKLFHGTPEAAVSVIMKDGLKKMKRHHVHLSVKHETAIEVGARRGKAVVLEIDAKAMVADNIDFFITENGVWLTDEVPAKYLKVL